MRILAIETSCDETSIAIVEFSGSKKRTVQKTLSHGISSQVKIHAPFGGVVPNLAKREHQKNLVPMFVHALKEAKLFNAQTAKRKKKKDTEEKTLATIFDHEPELFKLFTTHILPMPVPNIDAIAVTNGPGLAPALWVGINFSRALSYCWDKPLIPVNHMAGHLYSAFLKEGVLEQFHLPLLALLVSGGHTEVVLMRGHGRWKIIGATVDDAVGEAFDKVARLLNIPYPGGAALAALSGRGNAEKYPLPSPLINSLDYRFSFSGLKTAVLYLIRDMPSAQVKKNKADIAASFQKAAVDVLVKKTVRAAKEYNVKTITLGGGVAANTRLREHLTEAAQKELPRVPLCFPLNSTTGDNALMIAAAAYFAGKKVAWTEVQADANQQLS
ncbi:MAG: tRNA (adenosine(37)-N6)-threonylcarbamoyltransferase complex transferase subunit TsaD [Candidatus Sungbacteria bacterium]|nr:tRNA (adenosine(37)-N6)-threonylcarbamoyltransferase complex transferase subunit TsaD [Candidatus Sungbacteria bacterium]